MSKAEGRKWAQRPWLARVVRLIAFLAPIAVSVAAAHVGSKLLPRPVGFWQTALWWLALTLVATVALFVADRMARRLLPLAALLRLSLVFPDQAPSRFKSAIRTGTVRQLETRVDAIKASGFPSDATQSAEMLIELIAALSVHDRLTRGHAERVRAYSRMIGEELKLDEAQLELLQWSGLLHDVGKLFVPAEILNKPGRLTDQEFEVIKQHPGWGAQLCEPLRPWLGDWVEAVGDHHERWDGKGYPSGVAGEHISLAGRIVAVADVYDVITSVRSYKTATGALEARQELARCAGTQFDPHVVRAFLNISIGRLRLVMGPLSWLAQSPMVGRAPLAPVAGPIASAAAAAVTLLAGGLIEASDTSPPQSAEAVAVTTTVPAALPTLAEPVVIETVDPPPPTSPAVPITGAPVLPPSAPAQIVEPATTTTVATVTTSTSAPRLPAPVSVAPATTAVVTSTAPTTTAAPATTTPPVTTITTAPSTTSTTTTSTSTTTTTTTLPPRFAVDDSFSVVEDTPTLLAVGGNDVGFDPATAGVSAASANHGSVVPAAGGSLTYTPDAEWSGSDVVLYTIDDGSGSAPASAAATVTVTPAPDAPLALDDAATVNEDQPVTIDVRLNDTDVDGDSLTVVTASSTDGTATTDGMTVSYTPALDSSGSHHVSYQVADPNGGTATAVVTVTVLAAPDAPIAVDDTAVGVEDQPVNLDVLVNDVDGDGDTMTIQSVASADGAVSTDGTTIDFTPAPDTSGPQSISYTVDDGTGLTDSATAYVVVTAVNDAPAANDDAFNVDGLIPFTSNGAGVLANDSDEEGDPLTASLVSGTSHGFLSFNPDGSFTYIAGILFSGIDTFVYRADDGNGGQTDATVTLFVNSGSVENHLYLGTSGSSANDWNLTAATPPVSEPEYDSDGDGDPGLTIEKSDQKLTTTDPRKFQTWTYDPSTPLVLDGPVSLSFWSTAEDFNPGHDVDYSVWVLDCDSSGANCITLASALDVHVDNWNGGTSDWVYKQILIGSIDRTVLPNRILRVRLMFNHHDVWIASSGNRPSELVLSEAP